MAFEASLVFVNCFHVSVQNSLRLKWLITLLAFNISLFFMNKLNVFFQNTFKIKCLLADTALKFSSVFMDAFDVLIKTVLTRERLVANVALILLRFVIHGVLLLEIQDLSLLFFESHFSLVVSRSKTFAL